MGPHREASAVFKKINQVIEVLCKRPSKGGVGKLSRVDKCNLSIGCE